MSITFTATQKQRLVELDASEDLNAYRFDTEEDRDAGFKKLSNELVSKNRERLHRLRSETLRPALRIMEAQLVRTLVDAGFVEVCTPFMLSKGMLVKMGISEKHPLWKQIYWVEPKTCLRPMLAPHLYHLMGRTGKVWPCPIRLFEVGSCFRKESKGSKHLSEFTMLNLVEMGIEKDPQGRLEEMAALVMGSLNLTYELRRESSEVYGNTTDVIAGDLEIASGATGPHPLDLNWDIADNWAGLGLGLERLVMMKEGFNNIRRAGRSLIYLDGARLNI